MGRRGFLKRLGGGVAAAGVALNWKAEKPVDQPAATTAIVEQPTQSPVHEAPVEYEAVHPVREPAPGWWGDLQIEGMGYKMESLSGPTYTREHLEFASYDDPFTKEFVPGLPDGTLEIVLFGSEPCRRHMMDLITSRRKTKAVVVLPNDWGFNHHSHPANGVEFHGFPTECEIMDCSDGIPRVRVEWRLMQTAHVGEVRGL